MDKITLYYMIAITFIIVVCMTIMFFICHNNIAFTKKRKIRFYLIFAMMIVVAFIDFGCWLIENSNNGALVTLGYTLKFLQLTVAPAVPILLTSILISNNRKYIPWYCYGVYFVILAFLTGFNCVFSFDEHAHYSRHPIGFYFYVFGFVASALYLLVEAIILSKNMLSKYPYAVFVLFFALVFSALIQLYFRDIHYEYLFSTIILIIYYDYTSNYWNQMDGLTGLYSQFSFINAIKHIKDGQAIFVLDADDFKMVNDNYGHIAGDECLKLIAKVIQQVFGKVGRCYRFGGDEFTIIVSKTKEYEALKENFKVKIKETMKQEKMFPNVSIGYSVYSKGDEIRDSEDLADKEMYLDKARNKQEVIS